MADPTIRSPSPDVSLASSSTSSRTVADFLAHKRALGRKRHPFRPSCIGGAAQQDRYRGAIEAAGLRVARTRENPQYQFLSKSAEGASHEYGVKSISLLAERGL